MTKMSADIAQKSLIECVAQAMNEYMDQETELNITDRFGTLVEILLAAAVAQIIKTNEGDPKDVERAMTVVLLLKSYSNHFDKECRNAALKILQKAKP